MSTILYARSVLSPKSMLVWLMMVDLPRSGVVLPEDDSLLARLCMTTPRGLAKARAEIAAAGLDGEIVITPSVAGNKPSSTDRVRRYRERKALQNSVSDVTDETVKAFHDGVSSVSSGVSSSVSSVTTCVSPDVSGVSSCAQAGDARVCVGAEIDNQNKIILGLYTESESENSYTDETPNQILGDFLQKPPCESPSVAEPEILEPEITPPDPSAIRSAVSGMLGGVLVPMSDTPAEPATTSSTVANSATPHPEVSHAENTSRHSTPVSLSGEDAGTHQSTSPHDGLEISATDDPKRGNHPLSGSTGRHDALTADFEAWWKQVPRKVGKGAARKAYAAARKKTDAATLLAGIMRYAQACEAKGTEPQFICHPATWLNGERWSDDEPPDTAPAHGGPRGKPPSPLATAMAILQQKDQQRGATP